MVVGLTGHIQDDNLEIVKADRSMRILLSLWWAARQGNGGSVPTRPQLDPCSFPRPALPFMFVYERLETRFRCRLAGTKLRDVLGADGTGQFLDQITPPAFIGSRSVLFQQCLETGMPLFFRAFLAPNGREWRLSHRLLLPAGVAGSREPTQVLGLLRVFDPSPHRVTSLAPDDGLFGVRSLDEAACRDLVL